MTPQDHPPPQNVRYLYKMEEWVEIRAYPTYAVSTLGRVRNERTGRILAILKNQRGVNHVGLMREGTPHKKVISHLVAKTFLLDPLNPAFNSVINLDGDRDNNCVDNLQWRPLWFSRKYFRQFDLDLPPAIDSPVEDILSGEQFKTSLDASIKFGILDNEILLSIINRTYVWPTFQRFRQL